jgi:hypothetical protein
VLGRVHPREQSDQRAQLTHFFEYAALSDRDDQCWLNRAFIQAISAPVAFGS